LSPSRFCSRVCCAVNAESRLNGRYLVETLAGCGNYPPQRDLNDFEGQKIAGGEVIKMPISPRSLPT
jgi:hypothetical protein